MINKHTARPEEPQKETEMLSDTEMMNRALRSYFRKGDLLKQQPASASSVEGVEGDRFAVLRNVNGVLFVYTKVGRIRRLDDWPKEIAV